MISWNFADRQNDPLRLHGQWLINTIRILYIILYFMWLRTNSKFCLLMVLFGKKHMLKLLTNMNNFDTILCYKKLLCKILFIHLKCNVIQYIVENTHHVKCSLPLYWLLIYIHYNYTKLKLI